MNLFRKLAVIAIAAFGFTWDGASAIAACNNVTLADGVIVVGKAPLTRPPITPEVSTIQAAVDLAKDCEFQISGFTVPSGATVAVTTGSNIITNNQPSTVLWMGTADSIEQGELVQIGGTGKWYEVESVTDTFITLTRGVEQASGSYSYAVSITPKIHIIRGHYPESINLRGISYLYVSIHPQEFSTFTPKIDGGFVNQTGAPYGHLTFSELTVNNSGHTIALTGPYGDMGEHDTDVTIEYCKLVSTGVDSFLSSYNGNYVIRNSRLESTNDVAFIGMNLPPRSIVVEGSSFISAGPTLSGKQSIDIGARKLLIISAPEGGQYLVKDSIFSIASKTPGHVGISFSATSPQGATLNIENTSFTCTGCDGSTITNPNWMNAVVSAQGSGVSVNIDNADFAINPGNCAVGADQGATVTVTNSRWSSNNGGAPVCSANGGQVIY